MKFPILSTAIVTLCALTATAQAEIKISSVNIQELYTKFYKRFETENTLQKQLTEIKADVKVREDKLRALQKEIERIKGKYDSSLSDSAVAKLRKQFDEKVNELKAADQELKDFVQRREVAFREVRNTEMRVLMEEVHTAINTVADQSGSDLVLDSGAISPQAAIGVGTRVFPYMKKDIDLTPEVLKVLNAGAPQGFDPDAELKRLYGNPAAAPAAN
ncbi:MAG: OmpH family outer membrane protein [Akkermansia sp.]|nr:OmpH family outer membrane protein [Akkermansia sp.]